MRRARLDPKHREAIELLEREGYVVHRPRPDEYSRVDLDPNLILGTGRLRVGVVSDTHLGSIYQQVTYLREFYSYCAVQGVDIILHAGDVTDGPFDRHKNPHEVFLHDWGAIRDYCVGVIPDIGVPQYVISGNHDDWWTLGGGADIVEAICGARDDLHYVGRSQGYVTVGPLTIELYHPHDGSAYAYSYKPQKHVESLAPENKPHISVIGNYHKFCAIDYRNVWTIQMPSFQAQSAYLRSRSLVSEVGGVILEVGLSAKGLAPSVRFEVVFYREPVEGDFPGAK